MAIMQYVFGSFDIGVPKRIATASRHLNLHDISSGKFAIFVDRIGMAFAQTDNLLSPYRKFLVELSSYISGKDLETLKFAVVDLIPRRKTEDASSGLKLFDILEQDLRISPGNLSLLEDLFKTIGRMDLALKVQYFSKSTLADNSRNNITGKLNILTMFWCLIRKHIAYREENEPPRLSCVQRT